MQDLSSIESSTTVVIPTGVHHITKPVQISGTDIRIVGEEGAILRGTVSLAGHTWTDGGNGRFFTSLDKTADALYVNGRKYRMARYPKYSSDDLPFGGCSADCLFPEKTKNWAHPEGGYIHAIHKHLWGGYSYEITGKNPDGTLSYRGGWQNNRQMGMHDTYRFVENIFEEMTEPGEWYMDRQKGLLWVIPCPGDDLTTAEASVCASFFTLLDCERVSIENITFEASSRTFMETKEPLLRSDWTIYRGGAVTVRDSRDCIVDRCTFRDVGSNGVFTDGNCTGITIRNTGFFRIGASAVCFVGRPDCIRSPLFEYSQRNHISKTDLTPGPASDNYPRHCRVDNCLISHVGLTEKQASGVEISMAYGISVIDCTVCHTSRAGINISEGTFGGHLIEGCDVFDTVRETGDHGSFNSWGRDRYWNLDGADSGSLYRLSSLDAISPTYIRRSRFRCDHGWDIDLDDGSSHYRIEENLCLSGGIKLREGFDRTVRHNITVNNTIHCHAWYPDCGDIVEHNILYAPYSFYAIPEKRNSSMDCNLLHTPGVTGCSPADELRAVSGDDTHSFRTDCRFTDPASFNYIPGNPDVPGFRDFPTEFGVRYAPLRCLPEAQLQAEESGNPDSPEKPVSVITWCGMTGRNIETDGEMSVYGTAGHSGVLVTSVVSGSPAESAGLRADDVITDINGDAIHSISGIPHWCSVSDCTIRVLRKQIPTDL